METSEGADRPTILTVGHSTRLPQAFLRLMTAFHVQTLADIRTVPRSRHNPQYNSDTLAELLQQNGIVYVPMPGLGGLRKPVPGSPNVGWHHPAFRGYADYMLTPGFETSLNELIETAQGSRVAIMCAEAVPWRCHRSLVGDALLVRGFTVRHIMSPTQSREHEMTRWAHVQGTEITYPAETPVPHAQ